MSVQDKKIDIQNVGYIQYVQRRGKKYICLWSRKENGKMRQLKWVDVEEVLKLKSSKQSRSFVMKLSTKQ